MLVLTTPACPLREFLKKACKDAIYTYVSKEIEISITTISQVTAIKSAINKLPLVKNIIAVASGKGGVGKIYHSC